MNPLTPYEDRALSIHNEMTQDEVMAAIDFIDGAMVVLKDIKSQAKVAQIEWMKIHGEIIFGNKKRYLGREKKAVINDRVGLLECIIEHAEGAVDGFADTLSSSEKTFKLATVKTLIGEANYKKYCTETWKDKVVVKEIPLDKIKPAKELK